MIPRLQGLVGQRVVPNPRNLNRSPRLKERRERGRGQCVDYKVLATDPAQDSSLSRGSQLRNHWREVSPWEDLKNDLVSDGFSMPAHTL